MALPHLIKHIYNTGTDEVIRRGKKIHMNGFVELADHDELLSTVDFRVKDDSYSTYYRVHVQKYADLKTLNIRCSCPYNLGDICRHEVASLFQLQDLVDKNLLSSQIVNSYNQKHTVVKMKNIDLRFIRMITGQEVYSQAEEIFRINRARILEASDEKVEAVLELDSSEYKLILQKNEERNFDTSCTCDDDDHLICVHKTVLFLQISDAHGPNYFDSIRNWDKEKNKLLESYGYSLNEDLEGKFEFIYKDGKPYLKVVDPSIKKVAPAATSRPMVAPAAEEVATALMGRKQVLIVCNANEKSYPYFKIDLVEGELDEEKGALIGKVEHLDLSKFINLETFTEDERSLIQHARKFQQSEINKYLNRNSPFSGFWDNIIQQADDELPEETKLLISEFLQPRIKKIFAAAGEAPFFFLPEGKKFYTDNLRTIFYNPSFPDISFKVAKENDEFKVACFIRIENDKITPEHNEWKSNLALLYDGELLLWNSPEDALIVEKFKNALRVPPAEWPHILKSVVLPLTKNFEVYFDKDLVRELKEGEPEIQVALLEKGEYLMFQPMFTYKDYTVKSGSNANIIIADGDKVVKVIRNKEVEERFINTLSGLHSQFVFHDKGSLVLKGAEVLKNNWFFLFVDVMKEMKISVTGFEALKNFRFNTSKPSTKIHLSSGLDWFDARVELSFGEQKIGIAEIKKAMTNKQSFVQLNDGSLGILPDDWLRKYSLLFKVGDGRENNLRLSKYHMSVIDDLYEKRDEKELSFELDAKYQRLRNYKDIPEIPVPAELQNRLRPYQESGFHWLHYLKEVGWGGILADDMGLGKTVQALSMLAKYVSEHGKLSALVVCPTTLIYNWENEIRKFTPSLTWHIHHGSIRTRDAEELLKYNIIITTYGTLRSDLQLLRKIVFHYAVLDESQAIKNPSSKVTKAACLLNAENKLCMSGTPLQNNTFDIYAQMNFLNPGLLGSVEFFRNEFSTPIDKLGEQEQKDHLKKLLYPFILRRTKEQVAKDLPDKTETILYCEMEEEQRKVYEAYRHSYRDKILGSIDGVGMGKSQLTILQGLMKLRQICDSPAILNEDEKFPNHSIKLEELTREITENIGEHKALIFSQFLGMLALIKQTLKEHHVNFEYFDGSTPPHEREKAVQNFQNNDQCRVFLISLKAGGVGLNLTAADYVYIVDPWWNPAVEQQAIDRTHRIGQTKNIFAYRMICKDTIEDKIILLQERKRILAKELIADDQAFVKNLSKEDIEYLFS